MVGLSTYQTKMEEEEDEARWRMIKAVARKKVQPFEEWEYK